MKQRVKLLAGVFILLALIVLGVSIYALLTDTDEKDKIEFELGNLSFSLTGNIEQNYLYPGKDIVTEEYALTNNSNIDTEIRIKIRFYFNGDYRSLSYLEDYTEEDGFDFDEEGNFILNVDGFYYYDGTLSPEVESITLFTKLIFDGKKVKNPFESTDFKIELTLHAKQKDNVSWSDLGSKFI